MKTERWNVATRNREIVGICLPGNWMNKLPPRPAVTSLWALVKWLNAFLPSHPVPAPHYGLAVKGWETSCPGNTYDQWAPLIAA